MKYLVDANILSEPTKPEPDENVVRWLRDHERDLVVDPIVLGEIHIGVLSLAPGRKRKRLERWFESLARTVECLPWESLVSQRWARLVVEMRKKGRTLPVLDSTIAATALQHGLVLVTRNTVDFKKTGVSVVDPFIKM